MNGNAHSSYRKTFDLFAEKVSSNAKGGDILRCLFQISLFEYLRVVELLLAVATEAANYIFVINGNNNALAE